MRAGFQHHFFNYRPHKFPGDCVRSPALLKIRQAEPYPRGDNPKFFAHWIEEQGPEEPPFEEVCKKWEKD